MFDFNGKTVIVTGGAQGIGKEVVRGVVNGGGHAIIMDLNEEKAKETARELGNCSVYKVDLGSSENIRRVMAKVLGDFRRVDVLVNCGGVVSKYKSGKNRSRRQFFKRTGRSYDYSPAAHGFFKNYRRD